MSGLLAFIGGIGMWELLIVLVIVLLLFGSRLPGVMRSLGQGIVEFKKGVQGIEDDDDRRDVPPSNKDNVSSSAR